MKKRIAKTINTNVAFIDSKAPIADAVVLMRDLNISSVLVLDDEDHVVGIITERDIVQKFTLLDMGDKLTALVNTLMTRPVRFAQISNLEEDIANLHFNYRIRHFPVLNGTAPIKANVVGMVSVTDLLRRYLTSIGKMTLLFAAQDKLPTRTLHVSAFSQKEAEPYLKIFMGLGLKVVHILDVMEFVRQNNHKDNALLVDLDREDVAHLKAILVELKNFKGDLILTTSNAALMQSLRKHSEWNFDVMLKPIDYSYCHWLLTKSLHAQ